LFSPSLEYLFITDENKEITLSFMNPIIAKEILDESVINNVQSYFFPPLSFLFIPLSIFIVTMYFQIMDQDISLNSMGLSAPKKTFSSINPTNVTFVGYRELLEECSDLFDYNQTNYDTVGAVQPKGILFEGPPGNGKTFLAKYIASKTNATFIATSGSEFINMFVGVGATNIRELFQTARELKPCILFIDEIDSIGKKRGGKSFTSNDENDQTLNQLLTEMDGFNENNGITVIAATNRRDILDDALLRPGRFDRIVKIPRPDSNSRKAILEEHSKTKTFDPNINLNFISELTNGFSCAELKNLLNEAAILAARIGNQTITENNILDSIEKLTVGLVKKVDTRTEETRTRVAIHELGHAFLCSYYFSFFTLKKISIQSTYNGFGGYTLYQENDKIHDGQLYTKDFLKKRLIIAMGGKAAETVFYGDDFVSLGATQDLKEANSIAREMINQYGMGDLLEPFYYEQRPGNNDISDNTKEVIDKEILALVSEALVEAKRILTENSVKWIMVIETLLEKKVLSGKQLDGLFL
jgi:cell division protease FtsH